ncbi:MAG TPA: PIN domain-containing protein [Thermomicrobiales bacterium]|jgi:predicted nucleic acid-binding protein
MRLVIDASTVVAEGLRDRGRELLARDDLDITIAVEAWAEAEHELRKRVATIVQRASERGEEVNQLNDRVNSVGRLLKVSPRPPPAEMWEEARWRIPQDPRDIPTVALALWLDCGIWTFDRDFFGCGLPVWSTEVLQSYVDRVPRNRR